MEYVLSKSICKVLDRELRISHSFGGSNTLDCKFILMKVQMKLLKKLNKINFNMLLVKKDDYLIGLQIWLLDLFYIFLLIKTMYLLLIKTLIVKLSKK
jgi:hypothetical protein